MGNGITGDRLKSVSVKPFEDPIVDSLLWGTKWSLLKDNVITYSFPVPRDEKTGEGGYGIGGNYPAFFPFNNINENKDLFAPTSTLVANIRSALKTWENVSNIRFNEVSDNYETAGDIRFFFTKEYPKGFNGLAIYPASSTLGNAIAGDILLGRSAYFLNGEGSFGYTTIMHEIGHALGLKHPAEYGGDQSEKKPYLKEKEDNTLYTLMSYNQSKEIKGHVVDPGIYDIIAIQKLYGANESYSPEDNIYLLGQERFKTIWDPNGKNTLEANVPIFDFTVDARELEFSFYEIPVEWQNLYGKEKVYVAAVAQGTKIINVYGCRGNDILIGNAYSNTFFGNDKNDRIIGHGGEDIALYRGKLKDFIVTFSGGNIIVRDLRFGGDGTDILSGVSYIQFTDQRMDVRALSEPVKSSVADQLQVVYFGRGVDQGWRNQTADSVEKGVNDDNIKRIFQDAISDRAFSNSDSLESIVNKTFNNIFGIDAQIFEQKAWASFGYQGSISREMLPWTIFTSYLGANNVPPTYQQPAQSKIIGADIYGSLAIGEDQSIGKIGSATAEASREWLSSIRNASDVELKIRTAADNLALARTQKSPGTPELYQIEENYGAPIDLVGVNTLPDPPIYG